MKAEQNLNIEEIQFLQDSVQTNAEKIEEHYEFLHLVENKGAQKLHKDKIKKLIQHNKELVQNIQKIQSNEK